MSTNTKDEYIRLLMLLADIRAAVGDKDGKLMQDELVEYCRAIYADAMAYRRLHDEG